MTKYLTIIANWKMHHVALPAWVKPVLEANVSDRVQAVVCPPFTQLATAQMMVDNTTIRLGAQDCHPQENGAYTGDISADMLKRVGCSYVIVGHSERRDMHGETNEQVGAKAKAALEHGLMPVICVGESLAERELDATLVVIERQLIEAGLQDWAKDDAFFIAYEPIWAIGSGRTPTLDEVQTVHAHIKNVLHSDVPVLYGGSVKPDNAAEILALESVDGALVGGASLKGESFVDIMKAADG